ncbi:MAG: A24 family peptidase [Rhodospirillaceae bacterium]
MVMQHPFAWGVLALAFALVLACGFEDLRRYRIPNVLVGALLALYPLHVLTSPVAIDWIWSLALFAGVFALGVVAFATGKVGGGDVKLIAVCVLWAGPEHIFPFLITCAVAGGLMAMLLLMRSRYGLAMIFDGLHLTRARDLVMGDVVPYGLAIAIGMTPVFGRLALGG